MPTPSEQVRNLVQLWQDRQIDDNDVRHCLEALHPSLNGTDERFGKLQAPSDYPEGEFLHQQLYLALNRFSVGLDMVIEWLDTGEEEVLQEGLAECGAADETLQEILQEARVEQENQPSGSAYG